MSLRIWVACLSAILLVVVVKAFADETVNGPLQIVVSGAGSYDPYKVLKFPFPPRKAAFSTNRNKARCYANNTWNSLSYEERAGYIDDIYSALLKIYQNPSDSGDPKYRFSTRILTCKAYKESNFDTQIGNESGSGAKGMSQVVDGTGVDLFNRRPRFRSKIPGYEHITQYADFVKAMAGEPALQLELGLAVMERKRTDFDLDVNQVKPFLENYLGSNDSSANETYAQEIYDCAACVKDNGNVYTHECLCKANLINDPGCINVPRPPMPECN
jgi:hypothetical protein